MSLLHSIVNDAFFGRSLLWFFIFLHNQAYKRITQIATIRNNGHHPKHRIMQYHAFFISNIRPGSTVLDVGCGTGAVAFDIATKARKVVCIDRSKKHLAVARAQYWRDNIEYVLADVTTYPFKGNFDYVVLSNVLEHIEDRIRFLRQLSKLTRHFLIRVPLITRDWLAVYKRENGFEYRLDSEHTIEYTLDDFKREMYSAGLKIKMYSIQFGELWVVVNV